MESNKPIRFKYILFAFLPLLAAIILQYVVMFADILIIILSNSASTTQLGSTTIESVLEQDYNQPMNRAYMSVAQYLLFGLCFGIWFYLGFAKKMLQDKYTSDAGNVSLVSHFKQTILRPNLPFFLMAGYAIQIFVDGMLVLFRNLFPSAFADYDKLVSNVLGAGSSALMLVSIIIFAPIAEELLFRGLVLSYFRKAFHVEGTADTTGEKLLILSAILFQGLMFGIYHGNWIQGIYAFLLGSLFGWIAYRFNSILPCIVLHMAVNVSILFVPNVLYSSFPACMATIVVSLAIIITTIYFSLRFKEKHYSYFYKT